MAKLLWSEVAVVAAAVLQVAAFVVVGRGWQGNLDRTDHLDDIAQAHRIGEPAHRLFHIAAPFRVAGLILVGFGQQSQPAEAASLDDREIEIARMGVSDPLTLLLDQKPQPQIVELGHPDRDDSTQASRADKGRAGGAATSAGVRLDTALQKQCPGWQEQARGTGLLWPRVWVMGDPSASRDQLRQFLAHVQADPDLKRLVLEAVTADAVASLAQERGYPVSGSDILRFSGQSAAGVRVTRIDHPGEYPGRYV